jgi:drug/metabolite transporter (DMT)-like permease
MNEGHARGITAMLVCVACFAVMDSILKLFAGYYPPLQVGAMRGATSLPFVALTITATGRWQEAWPKRWSLHIARGLLALVMLWGFVYAVKLLSLADTYAIFFIAPLLVTGLSAPLLGETVGWRRWLAIVIGLSGALIMIRPSGNHLGTLGALAAIAAAVAYALSAISVRILTRTDSTPSMVLWFLILLTIFAGALSAPGWVPVRAEHWPGLVGLGATGALGQHFITQAFRHAPASVIAPFEYTALLWGAGIDWVVWNVLPGPRLFFGGGVVIASGLYLIWRERQLRIEVAATVESPASGH